jgi:proteasome accessory factor B
MSQRGTIKRYTAIIEKVGGKQFPSSSDVLEFLEDLGFSISKRTLERDFDAIRNEFGIEITYNASRRGYYIDEELSIDIDSFLRFLEIVNTADVISESLSKSKDTLKSIHFDQGGGFLGLEHLSSLLQAIRESREVKFNHFSYQRKSSRPYTMQPYLLKEYQNRWYVVGWVKGMKVFRTFGIDRLDNLSVTTTTFQRDEKVNLIERFNQTIGVVYGDGKAEEVILWVSPSQVPYVKSLPWHSSQSILEENDKGMKIALFIYPNYELIQQILMHHATVKVIEPSWLQEEVKIKLEAALKNYK